MTKHINPGTDTTINPLRCETCKGPCPVLTGSFFEDRLIREPELARYTAFVGCASHTPAHPPEAQQRIDAIPDTQKDLQTTAGLLYEFCEWFCDYDCEEKPCKITVSQLHEKLEGIKRQMETHPEYLAKWNDKRAEQRALLQAGRK